MSADIKTMLMNLSRNWSEFETDIDCPIQFSAEELAAHDKEPEGWNETADFWDTLDGFVFRDGWTSLDNYDNARKFFKELREAGLDRFSGAELADFELRSRWVVGKD